MDNNLENQKNDEGIQIDLYEITQIFLKRWWIILLAAVVGAIAMFTYTKVAVTPMYSSTASFYVVPIDSGTVSSSDLSLASNMLNDYKELIVSRKVINNAIAGSGVDISYSGLKKAVSLANPTGSRFIYVTVTHKDPDTACTLANAVSAAAQEAIIELMKFKEVNTIDKAEVPTGASSPLSKNVMIGFAGGVFLACAVLFILYMVDDKIKNAADVTKYLGLSTLGTIPVAKTKSDKL